MQVSVPGPTPFASPDFDTNMIPEEQFNRLLCIGHFMCFTIAIVFRKKLTMFQIFGCDVPFPTKRGQQLRIWQWPYRSDVFLLSCTSNEVNFDSSRPLLYKFAGCMFICIASYRIIILFDTYISWDALLWFYYWSIRCHNFPHPLVDNHVE